jgi:hypothetical protein
MRMYIHIDDSDYLVIAEWLARRKTVDSALAGYSVREFMHVLIKALVNRHTETLTTELDTNIVESTNTQPWSASVMVGPVLEQ